MFDHLIEWASQWLEAVSDEPWFVQVLIWTLIGAAALAGVAAICWFAVTVLSELRTLIREVRALNSTPPETSRREEV